MPDTSVYIPVDIGEVQEAGELPSMTYALDLDAGRIVGYVDGIEAVRQAIRKALITPRFKCLIYDNQYGSETEDAITVQDASPDYTRAVMEGFVKDALKPDTRILNCYNFQLEFQGDSVYISFTAETIFGKTEIEEVL